MIEVSGFPGGPDGKESACHAGDRVQSLSWEDPLEEGMATYSSILAWRIPVDRGARQVPGVAEVGHNCAVKHRTGPGYLYFFFFFFICIYVMLNLFPARKSVFLLGYLSPALQPPLPV